MGLLDFFDDKKKSGGNNNNNNNNKNNNNNNNNPLANIRKNIEQLGKPKMKGPGQSLGGAEPGRVYQIVLPHPGSLGVRVEKRSNNSASAIVNQVVPGSQAEAAGLKRGDVLCFAGSNGQNEMPFDIFLDLARSPQRPIHLEARRFDQKTTAASSSGSADAEARRRAMIAAAEAREKKHKQLTKTTKYVTKSTLLRQQQLKEDRHQYIQQQQQANAAEPMTEATRRAAQDAKRAEAHNIAQLGYNPYEAIKKTSGQARSATTATQHGALAAPGGAGSSATTDSHFAAPGRVRPPSAATTTTASHHDVTFRDDPRHPYDEFQEALATIVSSVDKEAAKAGLKISKKLLTNATTKGQQPVADAEKFRRVRLANPKIKAAIVDVPGNLPLMLSVGFALVSDDANPDESLLVFPPACTGPTWLVPFGLKDIENAETSIVT